MKGKSGITTNPVPSLHLNCLFLYISRQRAANWEQKLTCPEHPCQTQEAGTVLVWCWATEAHCGPASNHNWANVSCCFWASTQLLYLTKCCSSYLNPANNINLPNVGLMPVHRLWRWTSIQSTLTQNIVFAGKSHHPTYKNMFNQWWLSVGLPSTTLDQR